MRCSRRSSAFVQALIGLGVLVAGHAYAASAPGGQSAAPGDPVAHRYAEVDGAALMAFVFTPAAPPVTGRRPAIVLLHGGGWVAGEPAWTFASARRYAAAGFVAIAVQYRLSGARVTPVESLADVCSAFRWARAESAALGIDAARIAAFGVSAGGHLATAAATIGCDNGGNFGGTQGGNYGGTYGVGGPDALVLWSPALDVSADGHFRRLLRERAPVAAYSPVEHVRAAMPPVHIVQGERDTLTPLRGAQRFCASVRAVGAVCELAVYPGVGHLLTRNLANQEDDFDPDPAARDDGIARQRAFLERLWMR
jgi:acetyl esterase